MSLLKAVIYSIFQLCGGLVAGGESKPINLLGGAQPVIPPNLYSMFMNIIAWGPQVTII